MWPETVSLPPNQAGSPADAPPPRQPAQPTAVGVWRRALWNSTNPAGDAWSRPGSWIPSDTEPERSRHGAVSDGPARRHSQPEGGPCPARLTRPLFDPNKNRSENKGGNKTDEVHGRRDPQDRSGDPVRHATRNGVIGWTGGPTRAKCPS